MGLADLCQYCHGVLHPNDSDHQAGHFRYLASDNGSQYELGPAWRSGALCDVYGPWRPLATLFNQCVAGHQRPITGLAGIFYNAIDNIIPAKLGDVYAAHLVRINCGVGRASALGSIAFLRTLDAWSLLLHLDHIDAFNVGAQHNAKVLTDELHDVSGVRVPRATEGTHIYVYYPLSVDAAKRDSLRYYLLRHGVDTKTTDMSDCTTLAAFQDSAAPTRAHPDSVAASILEICVYPIISPQRVRRIAHTIRTWAARAT